MRIGMIGLGRMGGNMVERMLRSGHEVVAYTRDPTKVQKAVESGARGAKDLKGRRGADAPNVFVAEEYVVRGQFLPLAEKRALIEQTNRAAGWWRGHGEVQQDRAGPWGAHDTEGKAAVNSGRREEASHHGEAILADNQEIQIPVAVEVAREDAANRSRKRPAIGGRGTRVGEDREGVINSHQFGNASQSRQKIWPGVAINVAGYEGADRSLQREKVLGGAEGTGGSPVGCHVEGTVSSGEDQFGTAVSIQIDDEERTRD